MWFCQVPEIPFARNSWTVLRSCCRPARDGMGVTATAICEEGDRAVVDIARNGGFLSDEDCFDSDIWVTVRC